VRFLIALVFENDDSLKVIALNILKYRSQIKTTYQTNVASGDEERYTCYVRQSASMATPS